MTVMPSYYESFGMVALEAMACGKPVIASRVGGLTTTVQDGVTGYLVPEGNPQALADSIATLLDNPALRARLGREAMRWATQYRWSYVAESVFRLYAELLPAQRHRLRAASCSGPRPAVAETMAHFSEPRR
jgi:D-inositol-3-phosphate glycosyltransferase